MNGKPFPTSKQLKHDVQITGIKLVGLDCVLDRNDIEYWSRKYDICDYVRPGARPYFVVDFFVPVHELWGRNRRLVTDGETFLIIDLCDLHLGEQDPKFLRVLKNRPLTYAPLKKQMDAAMKDFIGACHA
ncbi:MAG: hypothetical protein V3T31_09220 [candidate division Zixibacteria bacterium]